MRRRPIECSDFDTQSGNIQTGNLILQKSGCQIRRNALIWTRKTAAIRVRRGDLSGKKLDVRNVPRTLRSATGTLRNAAGTLRNAAGTLRNATGTLRNAAGTLRSATGTLRSTPGNGPAPGLGTQRYSIQTRKTIPQKSRCFIFSVLTLKPAIVRPLLRGERAPPRSRGPETGGNERETLFPP